MFVWMVGIYCVIGLVGYIVIAWFELELDEVKVNNVTKYLAAHFILFLIALIWPVVIIAFIISSVFPSLFKTSSSVFDVHTAIINGQNEIEFLWAEPPYCSNKILFESNRYDGGVKGRFYFSSFDVEQNQGLKNCIGEVSRLNQEPVIKKWLDNRNSEDETPVIVPTALDRFEYIAFELIKTGKGEVVCPECAIKYRNDSLNVVEDNLSAGWNGVNISCPKGHSLFYIRTMHTMNRPGKFGGRFI